MEPFVKVPKSLLNNNELSSDAKIVYIELMDRMGLSQRNKTFYSEKYNDWFVLFSQNSMAKVIGRSERTVNNILKKLESLGFIKRVSQFNASDRIFLPLKEKITGMEQKKMQPSNIKTIKTITSDTSHTKRPEKTLISEEHNLAEKIELWKTSVIGASKISHDAIDKVIRYIHKDGQYDLDKGWAIVGTIYKAKRFTAIKNGLKLNDPKTRFENNERMNELPTALSRILNKAKYAQKEAAYIFTSLVAFFTDAMGIKTDRVKVCPQSHNDDVRPIKSNVKVPDWMNEEYDPAKDITSSEKMERLKQKMANLKNFKPIKDNRLAY